MKTRGLISTKFNQRHTEELTTAHKHGYGSLLLWERKLLQLFRSLCTQLKLNRRLFWWYSSGCTFRLNSDICERCRLSCVCMTLEMVVSRRCFKDAKRTKLLQPQSKNIPAYIGLEEVWELGLIILGKRNSAGSRERQKFVAFNALHFLVASWPLHRWKGGFLFFADCQWDDFEIEDVTWETLIDVEH